MILLKSEMLGGLFWAAEDGEEPITGVVPVFRRAEMLALFDQGPIVKSAVYRAKLRNRNFVYGKKGDRTR